MDKETWEASGLQKALGKTIEEAQGPFATVDGFRQFCRKESGGTNAETKAFIEKLETLLASAAEKETKKAK